MSLDELVTLRFLVLVPTQIRMWAVQLPQEMVML